MKNLIFLLVVFSTLVFSMSTASATESSLNEPTESSLYEALNGLSTPKLEKPDCIVVFDLTTAATPSTTDTDNAIFSFPKDVIVAGDLKEIAGLLTAIKNKIKITQNRCIATSGDKINVYVFHHAKDEAKVVVNEKKRETQLVSDLQTLINLAKELKAAADTSLKITAYSYDLVNVRANVNITAATGADEKSTNKVQTTVVTGPKEHWYLSADVAINKISELKYNSDTKGFESKEKPSKFMIGVNYMIGDVLTEKWSGSDYFNGITVKLLFEASNRPKDSLAFGLGYRMPPISAYGFSLDMFSPFIAYTSVNSDTEKAHGWIAGLSFNLDKALGWAGK